MITRLDYTAINPQAIGRMAAAKHQMPSINGRLRALLELRVSEINGCSYCIDLHRKEALAAGETAARLEGLTDWRNGSAFDAGECAALDWAESVTRIADEGAPEALLDRLKTFFTDAEIVDLTLIIAQMNAWNRLAISFGHEPD